MFRRKTVSVLAGAGTLTCPGQTKFAKGIAMCCCLEKSLICKKCLNVYKSFTHGLSLLDETTNFIDIKP